MNATAGTIHTVDLSAAPYLPSNDWKIEEHNGQGVVRIERRGEDLYVDGKKVNFFLADKQKEGVIRGWELRRVLKDHSVLNSNVLDHLLEHPELIPDSWKNKSMFFWGTIYRNSGGRSHVRHLRWDGRRWRWNSAWIPYSWLTATDPAVILSN